MSLLNRRRLSSFDCLEKLLTTTNSYLFQTPTQQQLTTSTTQPSNDVPISENLLLTTTTTMPTHSSMAGLIESSSSLNHSLLNTNLISNNISVSAPSSIVRRPNFTTVFIYFLFF